MKFMYKVLSVVGIAVCALAADATAQNETNLSGLWSVELPGDAKDGTLSLPGTLDMAGYGFVVDTLALSRDEKGQTCTGRKPGRCKP